MNVKNTIKLLAFWLLFILLTGEGSLRLLGFQSGILLQPKEMKYNWINLEGGEARVIPFFEPDSFGLLKPKLPLAELDLEDTLLYVPLANKLANITLNQDGFRGHDFDTCNNEKVKVLFLGDSFTFGFDAEPLNHCFVDQLETD